VFASLIWRLKVVSSQGAYAMQYQMGGEWWRLFWRESWRLSLLCEGASMRSISHVTGPCQSELLAQLTNGQPAAILFPDCSSSRPHSKRAASGYTAEDLQHGQKIEQLRIQNPFVT
jgi:hypothetical protein